MPVAVLSGLTQNHLTPAPNALHLLILNLMPNRAVTERQFTRLFEAIGRPVALTFCLPATHRLRHDAAALLAAYRTFAQVRAQHFDGLIITGAPLDRMPFDAVDFWPELRELMTWRRTHVTGSVFICWGADAAGALEGTFTGERLTTKINGVYTTDGLTMPQSRYFRIPPAAVRRGRILASGPGLGVTALADDATHSLYLAGHLEYLTGTLRAEFYRDLTRDAQTRPPAHYLDTDLQPHNHWAQDAVRVYTTWLNSLTEALS
ncbi:homoserine O-acetyltransferase/O-succinyltransferase family protein [Lacticaseibacillus absianus]|uniref:homoserine O-acetyltransferase/O-succinyltransferase family protein n=1 Tax=Lacticaseibacillus absianus TaxID=2729623 RepID=UPI0015CE5EFF|nr:homoserine O-succinyltransferase [Lacticaseibacillus absianus]